MKRVSIALGLFIILVIILHDVYGRESIPQEKMSTKSNERIDCFPDAESKYSGYSKDECLKRNCLFDDNAYPGLIQCYLSPNYGYQLVGSPTNIVNGLRYQLKRNQAIGSMFKDPIENVLLDVIYYTNDIIRFKLYDVNNQRYEVGQVIWISFFVFIF